MFPFSSYGWQSQDAHRETRGVWRVDSVHCQCLVDEKWYLVAWLHTLGVLFFLSMPTRGVAMLVVLKQHMRNLLNNSRTI